MQSTSELLFALAVAAAAAALEPIGELRVVEYVNNGLRLAWSHARQEDDSSFASPSL